jgi:hypothetical protein
MQPRVLALVDPHERPHDIAAAGPLERLNRATYRD